MKRFIIVLTISLVTSTLTKAQSDDTYWKNWDQNYPETNIAKVLHMERLYADSVERHPRIAPDYARKDSYRFNGFFLGKVKEIDGENLASIKWVLKLTAPQVNADELFRHIVLIKVGKEAMWMPIQEHILSAFKEEISENGRVTLYCLFLNHHTGKNKLYNHFLISEFIKK